MKALPLPPPIVPVLLVLLTRVPPGGTERDRGGVLAPTEEVKETDGAAGGVVVVVVVCLFEGFEGFEGLFVRDSTAASSATTDGRSHSDGMSRNLWSTALSSMILEAAASLDTPFLASPFAPRRERWSRLNRRAAV
jgi:hypothetical protein